MFNYKGKKKTIPQVHEKKGTEEGCCLTVPPTPPPLPTKLSSPYKKARLGMESGELSRYLPFPLRESGRDLPTVCTYIGSLQTKLPPRRPRVWGGIGGGNTVGAGWWALFCDLRKSPRSLSANNWFVLILPSATKGKTPWGEKGMGGISHESSFLGRPSPPAQSE